MLSELNEEDIYYDTRNMAFNNCIYFSTELSTRTEKLGKKKKKENQLLRDWVEKQCLACGKLDICCLDCLLVKCFGIKNKQPKNLECL